MSKFSYFTNWMGPINKAWCNKHGSDWSGGRIDISGPDLGPYGHEIGLPVMKSKDWYKFSEWLQNFESDELLTLEKLEAIYYSEGNPQITWFKEKGNSKK